MPSRSQSLLPFSLILLLLSGHADGRVTVSETVTLSEGWNAVWLHSTPVDGNLEPMTPEDLFGPVAGITMVTTPRRNSITSEFISSPGETSYNQSEWKTWRRGTTNENISLASVEGARPYLIHATGTTTELTFTGLPVFSPPVWTANAYNLRGFRLEGTITFDELLGDALDNSGDAIFPRSRIFTLDSSGRWVSLPGGGSDPVESGVAYWIRCEAPTTFMAPVKMDLRGDDQINFGTLAASSVYVPALTETLACTLSEIQLENLDSSNPATVTFDRLDSEGELRLFQTAVGQDANDGTIRWEGVAASPVSVGLEGDEIDQVTLGANRNWTTGAARRHGLFDVDLGGVRYYLPFQAGTADIAITADSDAQPTGYGGLWVGLVAIDAVSNPRAGTAALATTSTFSMPVILHVDDSLNVNLLARVTLMQTRPTDEDDYPEPILVLTQENLPFFEGVTEREGKKAGVRFESAGYDLPRRSDATTQAALASLINSSAPDTVTEDEIITYIVNQSATEGIRPSDLVESYHLKWPMTGTMQPGGSLATASPLTLDPFHRSNPFRHAFHPKHLAGFHISREISIVFDSTVITDELTGLYRETVSGLTQPDTAVATGTASPEETITSQGRILLRRVTPAIELDPDPSKF